MHATFTTSPPKTSKIRVVAYDTETGKSKSTTLHGTTPEKFIEFIESIPGEASPNESPTPSMAHDQPSGK
jgi:hypothetical protein